MFFTRRRRRLARAKGSSRPRLLGIESLEHRRILAGDLVLSEIKINPVGTDNRYEYVEIRGVPGLELKNLRFVSLAGDGADAGKATLVVNLHGTTIGSNGLLVIKSTSSGHSVADGTTVLTSDKFNPTGGVLGDGTNSFLLVRNVVVMDNDDYDLNNDGQLDDALANAEIVDSIAVKDGNSEGLVYGGVVLTQATGLPQAVTRFLHDNRPSTVDAWYGGDLTGTASDVAYTAVINGRSANFPAGGQLTPGGINVPGVNLAPIAHADSFAVEPGATLVITNPALGLLANDADPDDALAPGGKVLLSAQLVSEPADGLLVFRADGTFTYIASEDGPSEVTFTYRATDMNLLSQDTTVTIQMGAVANQPPTLALPGPDVDYVASDPDTILDPTAIVNDVDSPALAGGLFVIEIITGGDAGDELAIRNVGNEAGQIGVSGTDVTFGGVLIGSITSSSGQALVIVLNSAATIAATQSLARSITYRNTLPLPATTSRTVRFLLSDGADGTSAPATKTIHVSRPELPSISIADATVSEGQSGTTKLGFAVTLSAIPVVDVVVTYSTADLSATVADGDYAPVTNHTIRFLAGTATLTQTIEITVHGDNKHELDDQFTVSISATGASVSDDTAIGTILNDDDAPTVLIQSANVVEGDHGTTALLFAVSLSHPSYQDVFVSYVTSDGTATLANQDYQYASDSLTFPANTSPVSQSIMVLVLGDDEIEADETLNLQLTNTNAANASASAVGTITNDDFLITEFAVHADLGGANGRNNGEADTFRLVANGEHIELYLGDSTTPSFFYPLATTITIEVQGSSDDDTLILDQSGGFISATIVFSGGDGLDTLRIVGTAGDDRIDVAQDSPTLLRYEIGNAQHADMDGVLGGLGTKSVILTSVAGVATVEQVLIDAGAGDDMVQVKHHDDLIANGQETASLRFIIEGGSGISDQLFVVDDGLGDTTVQRLGGSADSGSYQLGALQPIFYSHVEVARLTPLDPSTGGTGSDIGGGLGRLLVFPPNEAVANNSLLLATSLAPHSEVFDAVIEQGDEDWYRVVANQTGVLDIGVRFHVTSVSLANGRAGLPGGGDLAVDLYDASGARVSAAFVVDGAGDHARVRIPAVAGQTYYMRVHGDDDTINAYSVSVGNFSAPVPTDLELMQTDGTTTILVQVSAAGLINDTARDSDMPPISIPHVASTLPDSPVSGFRVAIFVKLSSSQQDVLAGYAEPVANSLGEYRYTFLAGALPDGQYFVHSQVEIMDPATPVGVRGFSDASTAIAFTIDTTPPTISFGSAGDLFDGLHPASDTGVASDTGTFHDRHTADATPTFWGDAEPAALVRLYIDHNGNGEVDAADTLIAETVADIQSGHWQAEIAQQLADGAYQLLVVAEDEAGNISAVHAESTLGVVIDTQAPTVTGLFITSSPGFQLLSTTSALTRPTPLVYSLTVRLSEPLAASTAQSPDNYRLRGAASGSIPIAGISHAVVSGQSTLVLSFTQPLPDDRFTLTLYDGLSDLVGNALDGETGADESPGQSIFLSPLRSGDGQAGGDFVVQFTVDSRAELGTWSGNFVWVDTNGNGVSDPNNADLTYRDIAYLFAHQPLAVFAGNFSLDPAADGFDKLATYVEMAGQFYFLVDVDHDGIADNDPDQLPALGAGLTMRNINGLPVAGRFDASDFNGDEVGVFDGTTWYFDTNHNFIIDSGDVSLVSSLRGVPLVGDFDGDGFDDLATWANDHFQIDLARGVRGGWDGEADFVVYFGFASQNEQPIAVDMNADGIDDLGLWVPDFLPSPASGQWFFLVSGQDAEGGLLPLVSAGLAPNDVGHRVRLDPITEQPTFEFQSTPIGSDLTFSLGDRAAKPVVGNFHPPLIGTGGGTALGYFTNPNQPLDVDDDGSITLTDVALIISQLNARGPMTMTSTLRSLAGPFFDVSGDGVLSPLDALLIVNHLNAVGSGEGKVFDVASTELVRPANSDSVFPAGTLTAPTEEADVDLPEDNEPNLAIDSFSPGFYYWMWESVEGAGEADIDNLEEEEPSDLLELLAGGLFDERS